MTAASSARGVAATQPSSATRRWCSEPKRSRICASIFSLLANQCTSPSSSNQKFRTSVTQAGSPGSLLACVPDMFPLQREATCSGGRRSVRQSGQAQGGSYLLGVGRILKRLPAHELRDREVWPDGQ